MWNMKCKGFPCSSRGYYGCIAEDVWVQVKDDAAALAASFKECQRNSPQEEHNQIKVLM